MDGQQPLKGETTPARDVRSGIHVPSSGPIVLVTGPTPCLVLRRKVGSPSLFDGRVGGPVGATGGDATVPENP